MALFSSKAPEPLLYDDTIVLLDVVGDDLDLVLAEVDRAVNARRTLTEDQSREIHHSLRRYADFGVELLGGGVALVHDQLTGIDIEPTLAIVRSSEPLVLGDPHDTPVRFVLVLLSVERTHPSLAAAIEFAHTLRDATIRKRALEVTSRESLFKVFEQAVIEELEFTRIPPELRATGRPFGGMIADVKRRLPFWLDDWVAGLNVKVLGSVLFMYFACLAPAVAFGGLLSTLTGGQIGAIETLLASAVCGILWSIFAGQPLPIVGATGPNIIFTGILYGLCVRFDVPFLPTVALTGLWAGLFMMILAALDASALIRFFTRFTDEIFAALIALIFIVEAAKDIIGVFTDEGTAPETALLSLLLAVGTFVVARSLSQFGRTPYLRPKIREFLSDFGPAIAIGLASAAAWLMPEVALETLQVPDTFKPTLDRSWLISPLDAPTWVWFASALPAMLLTILIWVNQNITARLANSPDYKLQKGAAYHWDIAVMGVLVAGVSMFGLPWVVGAVVRSLNHVKSLAVTDGDRVVGVIENRLSNLGIHLLILGSLAFLWLLAYVPMAVLFGIFLYMGVGTLSGNQFMERARLWVLDPNRYPPSHYLRAVPHPVIHKFTAVQMVALVILWIVKSSVIGILFPFFIALLVPVRMLIARYFKSTHLALLDAEEVPADEEYRDFGM